MPNTIDVRVPDIGDFENVEVIEISVAAGDSVTAEDTLITIESDKATVDVPSPDAGTVKEVKVSVGDTVSEGTVILVLESADGQAAPDETADSDAEPEEGEADDGGEPEEATGGDDDARAEAPAVDDAAEPSRDGAPEPAGDGEAPRTTEGRSRDPVDPEARPPEDPELPHSGDEGRWARRSPTAALAPAPRASDARPHATPSVRRFARELGVDLSRVVGSGRKGRIQHDDVTRYVKGELTRREQAAGPGIPPIPEVDFSKFGEVEVRPLSRIKAISGPHLHRSWLNVPLVTHHDEADITELESFRQSLKEDPEADGVRVTILAFVQKAVAKALRRFPSFNASLAPDGKSLVYKRYYHVGIAVDTPDGLVVPVIRDVDKKGIVELAREMGEVSARARDGKLKPADLQGGCMSISSLGGIGGTGFTPLVNAPEVAILGVSRAQMKPAWNGTEFVPRLLLPLDLSYDHRVIDGAEAARFVVFLCRVLGDSRLLLL